jgi:alpha-tubulin suppressor-like RCC1 family protein
LALLCGSHAAAAQGVLAGGVAGGDEHSCALAVDGGVRCWGANDTGQLGDGTTQSRNGPVAVVGLSGLTATAVVAGRLHSCALFSDGRVRCWGYNYYGQLGDGGGPNRSVPALVSNLAGLTVVAIGAGQNHTCAVISDGTLRCWGWNGYGQLGDGSNNNNRPTPVTVQGLAGVSIAAVSGGWGHTCAVTGSGAVYCWGFNSNGQLGDATYDWRYTPVAVAGLSGLVATSVAVAGTHSCARFVGGSVRCWGWNQDGQLGDGTTVSRNQPVLVTALSGFSATAVTAGGSFNCALIAGAAPRCWGTTSSPVEGLPDLANEAIDAGGGHVCVLVADGNVHCWGDNRYGQIGDSSQRIRVIPVRVLGLSSVSVLELVAGAWHSCALISGGSVRCWGRNQHGQIGDGSFTLRRTPTVVSGLAGLNVTALSAGESHTCARIVDGSVRCWGRNDRGQLGDATTTDRNVAVMVEGLGGIDIVDVAVGAGHSCAIDQLSVVRCWGRNDDGQIGDGSNTDRPQPTLVSGLAGVTVAALEAGEWHNCVLLVGGALRCWGYNGNGQVGDGTTMQRNAPVAVANTVGLVATGVHLGGYHSCARFDDASVRCWGTNDDGQLGDGTTEQREAPVLVSGLGVSAVTTMALGEYHSCARLADGNLRCWGYNSDGQLGDGSTEDRAVPAPVIGLDGLSAVDLAAGGSHVCARFSDGIARCWGDNAHGQLGNGESGSYPTPQLVIDRLFGNAFETQ